MFVPKPEFLTKGRFKFKQNATNVSPLSKEVPKVDIQKIPLVSISKKVDIDIDILYMILKDLVRKFQLQNM